jgi:hypothetical protein
MQFAESHISEIKSNVRRAVSTLNNYTDDSIRSGKCTSSLVKPKMSNEALMKRQLQEIRHSRLNLVLQGHTIRTASEEGGMFGLKEQMEAINKTSAQKEELELGD